MKKKIGLSLFLASLVLFGLGAQAGGKTSYVAVKSVPVKASSDVFSNTLGTLTLGDAVTVLRESQKWTQIQTQASLTGWVSNASLTSRRPSSTGNTAGSGELALAGKGLVYSAELEAAYKQDAGVSYDPVDRMEEETVPDPELYQFLTEGRLSRGN